MSRPYRVDDVLNNGPNQNREGKAVWVRGLRKKKNQEDARKGEAGP